jgi:hypothetical protein
MRLTRWNRFDQPGRATCPADLRSGVGGNFSFFAGGSPNSDPAGSACQPQLRRRLDCSESEVDRPVVRRCRFTKETNEFVPYPESITRS